MLRRAIGPFAAAAVALTIAIGVGSVSDIHAQDVRKQFQKKAPAAKGPIQPRKGPGGNAAFPQNRGALGPRGQTLGPGGAPGQRGGPNAANPASRFVKQPGNRAFGNQPGNRAFGNNQFRPRGFTNRDPRLRAVNGATPQMRQVQRFSHRNEMFAVRARMAVFPLPGERNFTGVPPVTETRYAAAEMVCQWGADMSPQAIEEVARR